MAEVEVDTIAGWPVPPVIGPFTVSVTAWAVVIADTAVPITLPLMFTVAAEPIVIAVPAAPAPPVIEPVMFSVAPENMIPMFEFVVAPPIILPLTVSDPADWIIAALLIPVADTLPAVFPIINVFPAVEFNAELLFGLRVVVVPNKLPTNVIVPIEDLLIVVLTFPPFPIKLLPVMIKSQAPECNIVCVPTPVTLALGALIFTVPVVAVTVIRFVALAFKPAPTLALTLAVLKLNVPPDKLPAPEPVDSVSSSSSIAGGLPPANVIFIL